MPCLPPLKEKSDAPREIPRTIDLIPNSGPLRGIVWIQIATLQSDNGAEFISERLIEGCKKKG
eukprot:2105865-Prorocentrum_lima.AAC.1